VLENIKVLLQSVLQNVVLVAVQHATEEGPQKSAGMSAHNNIATHSYHLGYSSDHIVSTATRAGQHV